MAEQPHLCLIDGSGFIFRAFYALPPMHRPDGVPVNALYGFCQMMGRLRKSISVASWCVVFDAGRRTFRQDLYAAYKAHRPPAPDDLIPQFALIREACEAYAVPWIADEGFEADDLLATYTHQARHRGWKVTLVTSDKDMMQLVEEEMVALYDPIKRQRIGPAEVYAKFGVLPTQVGDVLALMGDTSDNIPGIQGIGLKTATDLIQTYGSLGGVYEQIHTVMPLGRRQKLITHRDQALLSHQLVLLRHDAPMSLTLEDLVVKPVEPLRWNTFLDQQGFHSLKVKEDCASLTQEVSEPPSLSPSLVMLNTLEALEYVILQARLLKKMTFMLTKTPLKPPSKQSSWCLEIAIEEGKAFVVPLSDPQTSWVSEGLSVDDVARCLAPLCADESVQKITYNLKHFMHFWGSVVPVWRACDDVMLLSYVVRGEEQAESIEGLRTLCRAYSIDLSENGAGISAHLWAVWGSLLETLRLTPELHALYRQIEAPLVSVLWRMEQHGVYLRRQTLEDLGRTFSEKISDAEQRIFQAAGQRFNVASPKQLGGVLFEHLRLPVPSKTKTGQYSTDSEVLESLADQGYTIAREILDWRQWSKLNTTYIEGLLGHITSHTQRVHTTYHMTSTATGRLSSSHPNLQNLPNRSAEGRAIRGAFQAQKIDHTLVWLDYSQIELRLLAHIADVRGFKDVFQQEGDIHTLTASSLFQIDPSGVTKDMRRQAKIINFGVIYGMSAYGLARQLGVPHAHAAHYIQSYFQRYPEILQYMERTKTYAREKGYVETLWGRRCVVRGVQDRQSGRRAMAERQAINAPIQGSQADMIKKAMVEVDAWLSAEKLVSTLILQVHDELVFECPLQEAEYVAAHVQQIMKNVVPLSVPLVVDKHQGTLWI